MVSEPLPHKRDVETGAEDSRSLGDPIRWPAMLSTTAVVAGLVCIKVAIQLGTSSQYGIFRDELYYLACAEHLAWGYVDHPPLIAYITWFAAHVFGTSLLGLRVLPAVAGGLLVWVTAAIARELGGSRFAQCIAAVAIIPVPIYLMLDHWLTMNAFEPLLWATALWLTARMLSGNKPRYWLLIGGACGIGLENKYSMLLRGLYPVAGTESEELLCCTRLSRPVCGGRCRIRARHRSFGTMGEGRVCRAGSRSRSLSGSVCPAHIADP